MPAASAMPARPAERVSTGIGGLDDVLLGGLQPGRVYLIEGTPGTGKTTLALSFLLAGLAVGDSALYVTLSETGPELEAAAAVHGWSLAGIDVFEWVNEAGLDLEAEQSVLHPSELELGETTRGVLARVRETRPARIVLDSLSELRLLAQNSVRYRRQVLALKQFFTQMGCTVFLLDDRTVDSSDMQVHSIVHGVITLEQLALDYGAERRRMRVVKLRGGRYRGGYHDFSIDAAGLNIYPRLVASEHHTEFDGAPVSAGNPGLDQLLGGGLVPGTSALLIGPSGAGKTTLATCAVVAALRRGERAAVFQFDEGLATLLSRSRSLGMDLDPFIASGKLTIQQINPAEMSPGEFASRVRDVVQDGARVVLIDSLNSYLHSMPGERYLLLQMHELLTYLNQCGVVTLMIMAQHGVVGAPKAPLDISYLSDTLILLRYLDAEGEVRKTVSVLKTRVAAHEQTAREFRLSTNGVEVGPPLRGLNGVLSHAPRRPSDLLVPLLGTGVA